MDTHEWRPIDTAPRDRCCIGYDPALKLPFVMIWNVAEQKFVSCGSVFNDETPTHWMPLPPLPKGDCPECNK